MKTTRLNIRVSQEHFDIIKKAAEVEGVTLTSWVTSRLLNAARREGSVSWPEVAATLPSTLRRTPEGIPMTEPTPPSELTPEERRASIAAVPPSIDPADAELVLEILGSECLLCGMDGHVIPADEKLFRKGATGPSNLQVLCDDCAAGAGDLRDEDQLQRIKAATDRP